MENSTNDTIIINVGGVEIREKKYIIEIIPYFDYLKSDNIVKSNEIEFVSYDPFIFRKILLFFQNPQITIEPKDIIHFDFFGIDTNKRVRDKFKVKCERCKNKFKTYTPENKICSLHQCMVLKCSMLKHYTSYNNYEYNYCKGHLCKKCNAKKRKNNICCNKCKCQNCNNEIVCINSDKYCKKCVCNYEYCKKLACKDFTYCDKHKCQIEDCNSEISDRSNYCYRHVCTVYACTNVRETTDYCNLHTTVCTVSSCGANKGNNMLFCKQHKCEIHGCENIGKQQFCENHKCGLRECKNRKNKKFCKKHESSKYFDKIEHNRFTGEYELTKS